MVETLTTEALLQEAARFAEIESGHPEPSLYGVTDGKAVGTYLERKFLDTLHKRYQFSPGSSAKGIDIPDLDVDLKVTSIRQPQSSSPYKSARQKVFGLGHSILIFVYEKIDDDISQTARLVMSHVVYVDDDRTGDYQMTRGLIDILDRNGNDDDLVAFMVERNLPVDDIQAREIASELMEQRPKQGYLTISNALQWRLQYGRVIDQAGLIDGIVRVR